ncbi:twist-related protein 1-like [Nannospalax galili]|uniref:twist-related protein 1-like n=1 Tax=Nannospalax galili TaxID=1026970 RepID=UPI00111C1A18|nr:twist-related protein 1-like [Nannospalax galili]
MEVQCLAGLRPGPLSSSEVRPAPSSQTHPEARSCFLLQLHPDRSPSSSQRAGTGRDSSLFACALGTGRGPAAALSQGTSCSAPTGSCPSQPRRLSRPGDWGGGGGWISGREKEDLFPRPKGGGRTLPT